MAPDTAAEQCGEAGAILDPQAPSESCIRPFALDVSAPCSWLNGAAQHAGALERDHPHGLQPSGVAACQLTAEPLRVDTLAVGPYTMWGDIRGGRLIGIDRFQKRVALARSTGPPFRSSPHHRTNPGLEIERAPGQPIYRERAHFYFGKT